MLVLVLVLDSFRHHPRIDHEQEHEHEHEEWERSLARNESLALQVRELQ